MLKQLSRNKGELTSIFPDVFIGIIILLTITVISDPAGRLNDHFYMLNLLKIIFVTQSDKIGLRVSLLKDDTLCY